MTRAWTGPQLTEPWWVKAKLLAVTLSASTRSARHLVRIFGAGSRLFRQALSRDPHRFGNPRPFSIRLRGGGAAVSQQCSGRYEPPHERSSDLRDAQPRCLDSVGRVVRRAAIARCRQLPGGRQRAARALRHVEERGNRQAEQPASPSAKTARLARPRTHAPGACRPGRRGCGPGGWGSARRSWSGGCGPGGGKVRSGRGPGAWWWRRSSSFRRHGR